MKLPATYFENLSNSKYRQYLKILPDIKKENTRLITTLILTLLALSFFGIFAINPTLTTIIQLQKQLEDSTFTHQQLQTKIYNLSMLQQKYAALNGTGELSIIEEAIPKEALATKLSGQILTLAEESDITLRSFRVEEVALLGGKAIGDRGFSYVFTIEAEGVYENMLGFAEKVTQFNRVVTVEAMSITKDTRSDALVMSLRGRQYFKP